MKKCFDQTIRFLTGENAMMLLLVIIFICIRFPSFYVVPFVRSSLFLTHNIARFAIILLFLSAVFSRQKKQFILDKKLQGVVFIYFFASSISVLAAQNISSFFTVYKDLVISLMLGYGTFVTITNHTIKYFLRIIIYVTLLSLVFEFFIYQFPHFVIPVISELFTDQYLNFFNYQYGRGRIFGETLNEAFLPLLIYVFSEKQIVGRAYSLAAISFNLFSTFISGWRTKALIYIFGLFSGILNLGKKSALNAGAILLSASAVLLLTNSVALYSGSYSIVERFLDVDVSEIKNDASRIRFWNEAIEIGASSPIIGVGLGNYFDHLPQRSKISNTNAVITSPNKFIVIDDPHNLFFSAFANTGLLGLFCLLCLVSFFVYSDIKAMKRNNRLVNSIIFSFWCLFFYSLLNPWMYFSYLSVFWLLRGLIEKIKVLNIT